MSSTQCGIERTARKLLRYRSRSIPPTPLDQICQEQKIRVYFANIDAPYFQQGRLLSTDCSDFECVIYIPIETKQEMRRWMTAHLLGHILLKHERCDYYEICEKEYQANIFATELLMPGHIIRKYIDAYIPFASETKTILELSEAFGVRPQDMWKRLQEIRERQISQQQRTEPAFRSRLW